MMMRRLAGMLALAAAHPAAAQVPEMVRDTAGSFLVVPVDGSAACSLVLGTAPVGKERWSARPDPGCARRVGIAGVTAWRLLDGILLLDAAGRTRMTFAEDETALPTSPDLMNPRHYLVPRIAGFTHLPGVAEWARSWTITRPGQRGCSITLGLTPSKRSPARERSPARLAREPAPRGTAQAGICKT